MHCTIYAIKALEAGMDTNFIELEKYHKQIWKGREHAGWSVGYILCKYFDWTAYLIVSEYSEEYKRCMRKFNNEKKYYVWRQPDIPIKAVFDMDKDKLKIDSILKLNEFG